MILYLFQLIFPNMCVEKSRLHLNADVCILFKSLCHLIHLEMCQLHNLNS